MKKTGFNIKFLIIVAILFMIIPLVRSEDKFTIEKQVISNAVALELDSPAEFDLTIKNNQGSADLFEIYSLSSVEITPAGTFSVDGSSSKTIRVKFVPKTKTIGAVGITYYVKGYGAGPEATKQDSITIRAYPLSQIILVGIPESITRDDEEVTITFTNTEKINFGDVQISCKSDFFDFTQTIAINGGDKVDITVPLKNLQALNAGKYPITFEFTIQDKKTNIIKDTNLVEITKITESEFKRINLLSYTRSILRKNDGNTVEYVKFELSQNFFERFFTSYNIKPSESYGQGLNVVSVWKKELKIGDSLDVKATISYVPLIILLGLLIVAYIIYRVYNRPRIILRKKMLKVKTVGGEFALKIVLIVKNIGKEAKDVVIVDRIPVAAKIHEHFGAIKPEKVEHDKLLWKFEQLMPGEEHVLSYVVYSKVTFIGKLNVPIAVAHYSDVKGKRKIATSTKLALTYEPEIHPA